MRALGLVAIGCVSIGASALLAYGAAKGVSFPPSPWLALASVATGVFGAGVLAGAFLEWAGD